MTEVTTERLFTESGRQVADHVMRWTRDKLPPFNTLVVAYLEGAKEHSGALWGRSGYAFMVRHDDPPNTVADGYARDRYERALKDIGADYLTVKAWLKPEFPMGDC